MMLGKRPFRRTTSMTGITVDMESVEAAPPPPPPGAQRPIIGGQYDHMLSPRYNNIRKSNSSNMETADFLRSCGLCNRRLVPGRDIYMYRGDTAFCSLECREQQMKQDERKERREKNGETRHPELVAAASEAAGKSKTAVAA